jgi:hypothetical protein
LFAAVREKLALAVPGARLQCECRIGQAAGGALDCFEFSAEVRAAIEPEIAACRERRNQAQCPTLASDEQENNQ